MPELNIKYEINESMCTLTWNSDEIPYIRYSVTGASVTGRNRIYSEPFWIGNAPVLNVRGYDADLNPITEQISIDLTKSDEVEVETESSNVTKSDADIAIPDTCDHCDDKCDLYDTQLEKLKNSEYEQTFDQFSEFRLRGCPKEETEVKEEVTDTSSIVTTNINDKPINQAIEESKPNYVKVIYKSQFNSYHIVVYRNYMTEENSYFFASPLDVLSKIEQFKPSKVRISLDKYATNFIRVELLNKGYTISYI